MWLINSSVGRKFVMAITGVCLVLFVTFHVLMNSVAILWPAAYNQVCEFLGANWYALVASAGLAALFIIHIIYAVWLTFQNRAARGADRYAVNGHAPQVEWSSKNMLVLGIVVLAFLAVHLIQFWAKMQWQELRQAELEALPQLDNAPVQPAMGTLFIEMAFKQVWTPIIYIIGFIALWFHMNHGFWSMFQTVGWNNDKWLPRLKKISCWWTSIVVALFIAQAVVFTVQANRDYYSKAPELKEQYAESWNKAADNIVKQFQSEINTAMAKFQDVDYTSLSMDERMKMQEEMQTIQEKFITDRGQYFFDKMTLIDNGFKAQCSGCTPEEGMQHMLQLKGQLEQVIEMQKNSSNLRNNQK